MLESFRKISLNAYHLKMIALITMLMDHFARVLFPELFVFKVIGRVAFVLYSFMLVEGFMHTRDNKKYFFKLLFWAIISEIPYDLAFGNQWFDASRQNIFFTLATGLAALFVIDSKIASDLKVLLVVCLVTMANIFHFDYLYLGVLQVLFFYVYRSNMFKKLLTIGILNVFFMFRIATQAAAILAFVPIYFYNGERGKKTGNIFYSFYAVHLFIFWLIKIFLLL